MTDVPRLLAAFESGRLARPSADVPNIVDLSRALASLTAVAGVDPTPGAAKIARLIPASDHLVFVVADGLGMEFVESLDPGSFMRTHMVTELRTVFPSGTAAALTSLATGQWPGVHGVTGWWTHLPEIGTTAAILPFVNRSDGRPLADLGMTAGQAFPVPSLMRGIDRDVLALFPKRMADGVYTRYFAGGMPTHGYGTLRDAMSFVITKVATADRPTYTYLYSARIDAEGHRYGVGRPEVGAAVLELDRELERVAREIEGRCRLVMVADHGFLNAPVSARHHITPSADLMSALRFPPSGDARALYFHVRDGAHTAVRRILRRRLRDRFLLISVDEAESIELFGPGPLSAVARSRLGDLIAISHGQDVAEYGAAGEVGRVMHATSHHSGLSRPEMQVPLVVA